MPIISPKIPSGLEELMKGLAKSVIKENPQNIYEFAAEYFENLLKKRDGPVDQSYKDFATYKVYRKNKSERFMIEKENLNDVIAYKRNLNSVNYDDSNVIQNKTKSTEEGIIVESNHSIQSTHKSFKTDTQESENNESIKKEKSIEVHSEAKTHVNDDIKNIVLDNDMEQAALKIQSTFREFKGRKEKRRKTLEGGKIGDKDEVDDETDDQGNDFNGSNFKIVEVEKEENPKIEKENLLNEGKSEADDVSKMIFDDDMEQAALKIQSTFRGHKARKEINQISGENLGHKNSICNLQQANTKEFEIQERSYEDNSIAIQKSVDLETEAIKTLTEEEYKPEHDENTFQTNFLLEQQLQGNDKNSVVEVTEETFMEKNVSDTSALPDKNDMETKAETLNDIELLNITSEVPAVETVKQSSIDETVVVEDQKEVKALNIDSVKDKLEQAFNEVHDFFEAEKVTQTLNTHSRKEKIVQGLDEIESSIQDEKVAKTLKTKSEQYEAEQILQKVECFIEAEKVTETQHDFQKADVSVEVGKVTENIDTLQEINEAERTLTQVEESLETEEAPKTLNVQGDKDEIKQSLDKVNSSFEIEKNAETLHISPEQDLDEVNKSVAAEKYTETMNTQSKENNVAAHIEQETTHKSKNSSIKSFPDLECTIIKSSTESQELSKNLNISESLIDNLNSEAFINNQINNISENFDVVSSQDATIVDPEKSLESFDAENISIFATNISDSTNFPIEIQDSKIISDKVETSSEINGTEKVNIDEFIELENVISEDVKNKSYDENLLLINDNITTKETQNYSSKNKKEKLNVKDEFPVETFTVETKASEVIKLHDNVHSIGVSKNLEDNIDSNDIKKVDQTANVIIQENTDELQTNNKANAGDVKIDDVPVNEPICKKKLISLLEPDQDDDDEKKTITDKDNEILSNEIKYAKLEESLSGADIITGESFDEGDYYSQLINNESSTNEEASHLNQQSYDEASHKDTVLVTSSPDDEKNDINFIKDSNADQRIQTTSNEIQTYISEINVIKENVKDAIDVIASDNSNVIQKDIISQKEIINDHVFEPKLIVENPISEITASELIDLNKEIVNVNRDELEAIKDEILQPESEQSEIPDEKTNAPEDENVPIISMDEKSLPTENEKNVSPENEFNVKVDEPKVEDDVNDMIINENMENTTLKIEEDFSVHKVDNDILKQYVIVQSESEKDSEQHNKEIEAIRTVVIDQCSDEKQEIQENEKQDTNGDIEEFHDSETLEEEEEEKREDAQEEEEEETKDSDETETAIEVEENETTENAGDYPDGTSEEEEGAAAVTEQPENTEDDDVANMVLDEEMEKAALKIQSKFRGHKTRIGVKRNDSQSGTTKIADESKQEKDSTKDVDEEIANMVLDDEMAKAALKIQSTFRGHKTRKDIKKNENSDKKNNEEEEKSEENENLKNEEATQSSSTEKSAKQLQDEEDIANLVMDTEMEQTALKIQSAFRVKSRKKLQKENESSTRDNSDDEEHDDKEVKKQLNSNEDPFKQQQMNEDFESVGEKSSEEKNSDSFIMANYCYPVEESYYIERYDSSDYEPLETSNYEINLMQGGGTFPELSGESSELLTSNSNEEKNPERNNSLDTISARDVYETSFTKQELTNLIYDEKITENFYFNGKKNSAEELYYSLKKNELETQRNHSHNKQLNIEMQSSFDEKADDFNEDSLPGKTFNDNIENKSDEATAEKYDEDDDDVVIGARVRPTTMKRLQYGMSMDERFLGSTLSQNYSENSQKDVYPNDRFNPVLEERIRSQYFLEKLHEKSTSDEDNKCNSEDLFDGTGDEDQFDDFYNSENLRKKIMASSFSITDSDYYDPVNIQSIIEDDKIRTALETIHSTDSESTIASAATKIPYEDRKKMKHNNNSTSQSMQYSSIGNSAIDKSLEDFIQSQELRIDRFDEDDEEYDSPLLREPQSTDIWTNDPTIYTDSEKRIVVGIKMKQKNSSLTVDERRRTLHREDAIQRNSTREDEDSSKSSDAPGKKLVDKKDAIIEGVVAPFATQDLVINTENSVLTLDIPSKPKPANQVPVKAYKMKRQHTMPVQIQSNVIRVVPKHLRKRIKSADGESKRTSLK